MNIPDAAVEAAAEAIREYCPNYANKGKECVTCKKQARAAIEVAMPAIREALAQELERRLGGAPNGYAAARIVRGGTP